MDEVYDGWVSTQVALMEHFSKSDTDHKVFLSIFLSLSLYLTHSENSVTAAVTSAVDFTVSQ